MISHDYSTLICHQKITPFNISSNTIRIQSLSLAGFPHSAIIPSHITIIDSLAFYLFNGSILTVQSSINTIANRMFLCGPSVKEIRILGKVGTIESAGISG